MNELQLLDELVAPFSGEPGDWPDVIRRAQRRRPRRRLVLATVAIVAALAAASAVALPFLRSDAPKLPSAADRKNVLAVIQPRTGRVLIEAAPWKGHDGVCYLIMGESAGCTPRGERKALFVWSSGYVRPSGRRGPALWGFTFDPRVASARIYFSDGTHRSLPLHRFGGRLPITFIGPVSFSGAVPHPTDGGPPVRLYDRSGRLLKGG